MSTDNLAILLSFENSDVSLGGRCRDILPPILVMPGHRPFAVGSAQATLLNTKIYKG